MRVNVLRPIMVYHVSLAFQYIYIYIYIYIYGCSNERCENEDIGRKEKVEIALPLICK